MPRTPKKKLLASRFNMEVSTRLREKMEVLQQQTDAGSISEVVRLALEFYAWHVDRRERGSKFFEQEEGGKLTEIIFPE